MKRQVTDQLRMQFRPEFLNRIDEVIVFHALTDAELAAIADLQLADLQRRIAANDLVLELTPAARALIVREGTDPAFGARPLKRTIQRLVENPFARALLSGSFKPGDRIVADADPVSGTLVFSSESSTVVADASDRRDARVDEPRAGRRGRRVAQEALDVRPAAARRAGAAGRRRRARQLAADRRRPAIDALRGRRPAPRARCRPTLPDPPEALIPVLAETGAPRPRPPWDEAAGTRSPGGGADPRLPRRRRRGPGRADRARRSRRAPLGRGLVPRRPGRARGRRPGRDRAPRGERGGGPGRDGRGRARAGHARRSTGSPSRTSR